jgi:HEPN domain-containing protein
MPPELRDPTDPREWLRRSRSNLARARAGLPTPEVLYEDLAFDAQQAAEKAIKAVLLSKAVAFPKTHALVELFDLVEASGVAVPAGVREAGRLTVYAVETRYPGTEDVTEEEYLEALELAERVVAWAEAAIGGHDASSRGKGREG